MDCPICRQEMPLRREYTTYNKARKPYNHKTYNCAQDDTWISVEIPEAQQELGTPSSSSPETGKDGQHTE
ncbi:hypothetical protein EPA93_13190 [Ktedonosporobacter rubrisoli]|uniref:Zinc finger Ogr/Delta-type domain-containing protein n=1 Tax=Ktedonosporobacter rubrisoli TaxID=2509675 RepID=A0A4P6JNL1_KTERU|nr:hypothetical protein [Ktedonosporobacter rubrisoli]QBD76907.1 hypothetical protein EPA93_13190 [Ktedonosporobacter rubrisoli]